MSVYAKIYPEVGAGGFTRYDGTVQFFSRVNALLSNDMRVLDFGAGRGLLSEHPNPFLRNIANLKGRVKHVAGVDIDPVVTTNPTLDEAYVFDGRNIPAADCSFDLIFSDNVFEHIQNPHEAARELSRVLKPNGWLCARTPYIRSAAVLASRLVPNRHHAAALSRIQPDERAAKDVFPTAYRLNSPRAIRRYFPPSKWEDYSYQWNPESSYHFGSPIFARALIAYQYLRQPFGGEVFLIFLRKKA